MFGFVVNVFFFSVEFLLSKADKPDLPLARPQTPPISRDSHLLAFHTRNTVSNCWPHSDSTLSFNTDPQTDQLLNQPRTLGTGESSVVQQDNHLDLGKQVSTMIKNFS